MEIDWNVRDGESGPRFGFRWQERGGPPVIPPSSRGFGSTLLKAAIPSTQGGTARLQFEEQGFAYEFDAPLRSVTEDNIEEQEPTTPQTGNR